MVAILGAERPGNKIVNRLKSKKIDAIVITPSLHDINFKKKIFKHTQPYNKGFNSIFRREVATGG